MADINLKMKDLNIPDGRNVKVVEVLREVRTNHNELVDAINSINDYLRKISEKLDKIPDIEKSTEFNAQSFQTVTDKLIPELQVKMNKYLSKVKTDLLVVVKDNADKLIALESHSRRKNVIINGIPWSEGEEVETLVRDFFKNKLEVEPLVLKDMLFRDTHRLPAHKLPDGRVLEKPIIVAFISQKHRNLVMKCAYKLKDTGISIKSDLPKSLNDLRNKMLKERHRLKVLNPLIKYRVAEVRYMPILQKSNGTRPGTDYILWEDLKFTG